jgi:hypothetical protein
MRAVEDFALHPPILLYLLLTTSDSLLSLPAISPLLPTTIYIIKGIGV